MHPTAGQSSGRNSAGSSRFAESVASTMATSDGPPDRAESVRDDRARPSVRLLAPTPKRSASFSGGPADLLAAPPIYSLLAFLGLSREHRPSSTEWDEVLAKDRHREHPRGARSARSSRATAPAGPSGARSGCSARGTSGRSA